MSDPGPSGPSCFVGRAIHEFKIPIKYLFTLALLHIIEIHIIIQVSANMSINVIREYRQTTKLNHFTVLKRFLMEDLFSCTQI